MLPTAAAGLAGLSAPVQQVNSENYRPLGPFPALGRIIDGRWGGAEWRVVLFQRLWHIVPESCGLQSAPIFHRAFPRNVSKQLTRLLLLHLRAKPKRQGVKVALARKQDRLRRLQERSGTVVVPPLLLENRHLWIFVAF